MSKYSDLRIVRGRCNRWLVRGGRAGFGRQRRLRGIRRRLKRIRLLIGSGSAGHRQVRRRRWRRCLKSCVHSHEVRRGLVVAWIGFYKIGKSIELLDHVAETTSNTSFLHLKTRRFQKFVIFPNWLVIRFFALYAEKVKI